MLVLVMRIGNRTFALEARRVIEVVPMIALRPVTTEHGWISGQFDYRGDILPVVDLRHLLESVATKRTMATRILVVAFSKSDKRICLLAEHLTETAVMERAEFMRPSVCLEPAYMGGVSSSEGRMVELIEIDILVGQLLTHLEARRSSPEASD